jgi:hypothetical protein
VAGLGDLLDLLLNLLLDLNGDGLRRCLLLFWLLWRLLREDSDRNEGGKKNDGCTDARHGETSARESLI